MRTFYGHFSLIATIWFPGSAWEPNALQAPPAEASLVPRTREAEPPRQCVPRQEPGNERVHGGVEREVSFLAFNCLRLLPVATLGLIMLCQSEASWSQETGKTAQASVSGFDVRTPWTTSAIHGFPDPPPPLKLVDAYPQLKIPKLITLGSIPKTDWLLAVDHENDYAGGSRARQFRDQADVATTELFLDTPEIIYGFAWHPQFETNHWVYVGCNGHSQQLEAVATKVLRFKVDGEGPYRCDPESRTLIIEWPSNGHNGGDLVFGNDGLLYVSAGDGTSDSDTDRNGQDLSTLAGSLLRIDVDMDRRSDPRQTAEYRIPADNPFVDVAGARGEIWAYGLRNPWRISFDSESNQLWVGNNGQDLWESAYLVERGANYGWSINESNHPFHTQQDHGPVAISAATVEHHHSESRSLTGGHVYRGSQFPKLVGAYVYGDYSTGNIWMVRHDGERVIEQRLLARSRVQIIDYGFDSRGELLIADHEGGIYRFAANDMKVTADFPKRLSQTGLFEDVVSEGPAPGVIPYSVNSPLWSDGAIKKRWLAVPNDQTIGFAAQGAWDFPEGSVLVKSFAFATLQADVNKLVETRLLAKQQGEWYGYSYRWNAEQSDAYLVEDAGSEETLDWVIEDGQAIDVRWRYPSRSECMVCHSRAAKYVLGLSTEQMNRQHEYYHEDRTLTEAGQIDTLAHIGLFGETWKTDTSSELAKLVDPYDESQDIDPRARSYLHVNCASCHVNAGGGNSKIVLDYFTTTEKMNLFEADPLHTNFGVAAAKLVRPTAPDQSVLFLRMSRRGEGQMPPLASFRVDTAAVELMRRWIGGVGRSSGVVE